jgi:hypothetical protein
MIRSRQLITFEALKNFARANDGRILRTAGGRAKFMLTVHDDSFEYTPLSTRIGRPQKFEQFKRVLDYYNQTNSLKPTDYGQFDVNASYALTLIKLVAAAQKTTPKTV